LDSLNASTHDYLRGVEGVYKKAVEAISFLDRYCPRDFEIIICSVIYDINLNDIIDVAQWVNNHSRIKWIYFMAAMQPNNTGYDSKWYEAEFGYLWPKDKDKSSLVIDNLIQMKNKGYKINNQICQLEAFKKYFSFPDRFVKNTSCNLNRAVHISSVGDIFICYDWDKLGNIAHNDIAELWLSKKAQVVRENILGCKKNCHHLINCFFEGDYPFTVNRE
ncbi:MAG: SPASM domain-containing protein, partial [Candidatus Omnitrophica bacterium]|nr:SPASM domain-containing protein [Candidatus Omnitrophota bacterium]